jgi:hypothetical protein
LKHADQKSRQGSIFADRRQDTNRKAAVGHKC